MASQLKQLLKPWVYRGIDLLRHTPISSRWIGSPKGSVPSFKQWCLESGAKYGVVYHTVYPEHDVVLAPALSLEDELHWRYSMKGYTVPEAYVVEMPEFSGRTWGQGNVITPDEFLVEDVSITFKSDFKDHDAFWLWKYPQLIRTSSRVASLVAVAPENYYHWLFDTLPRLHLLEKAGVRPETYIVCDDRPFQRETLERAGIGSEQRILADANLHLSADPLCVPSLPGEVGLMPKWACRYLAETFGVTEPGPARRIYLARGAVNYRQVTNEKEVQRLLCQWDFTIVDPAQHSVAEQAALMKGAEIIVAPHGAAMTNLVFASAGAKVIEILSPIYVNPMYSYLASQVGVDYYYLIGEGERPAEGVDPHRVGAHIEVNLDQLDQLLRQIVG